MITRYKLFLIGLCGMLFIANSAIANTAFYENSYAVVIGIDNYPSNPKLGKLNYAVKDAKGVAQIFEKEGFKIIGLYDNQATKENILEQLLNNIAPQLKAQDRVMVFFAGHGYTEPFNNEKFGYIIPYDGTEKSATYISMEELQTISKKMGKAKHQLFIMDTCYGGSLGIVRSGAADEAIPNYLEEVTKRQARQVLTAGGENQQVVDNGPGGFSLFTGKLLEALEGAADKNKDGYVTFYELMSYLVPAASNSLQTPSASQLPGHELGEFVFRVIKNMPFSLAPKVTPIPMPTPTVRGVPLVIQQVVITDSSGKILYPTDDVYTLRVGESVTITVELSDLAQREIGVAWVAGNGQIEATDKRINTYTATGVGGDYITIEVWDIETGEELPPEPITLNIVP